MSSVMSCVLSFVVLMYLDRTIVPAECVLPYLVHTPRYTCLYVSVSLCVRISV